MAKNKPGADEGDPNNTPPPNGGDSPSADALATQAAERRMRPIDWAKALGCWFTADPRKPQDRSGPRPEHAAADALYKWSRHAEMHEQGAALGPDGKWWRRSVRRERKPLLDKQGNPVPDTFVIEATDGEPEEVKVFTVTERQYREALRCAGEFPTVAPFAPAIPPSQTKRFRGFKPRKLNSHKRKPRSQPEASQ